jgi:hypothetical protein
MLKAITRIRSFRHDHPFLCAIIALSAVPIVIVVLGVSLSTTVILTSNCQPTPTETCDGIGLIAVSIWSLSFSLASIFVAIVGIVAVVVTLAALLAYVMATFSLKKP